MEEIKPKVVPSGKVYRQIFDAEVQLVRALEGKPPERCVEPQSQQPVIPVVKDSRGSLGAGMLNERQKTWIESFPNESDIENPVLIKYYSEEERRYQEEPESHTASKEVRGLPDVLAPVKKASDIIERIAESRKMRHETTVEDMHQELGIISSDMEPRITEIGENMIRQLAENDKDIERVMTRISEDANLMNYSIDELHDLWDEAANESVSRIQWISDMDQALSQVEDDRMITIKEVFQGYAKQLEKIAHLMQPDLQRLLDKESQLINQTVLSNRRAYADLYARLMMSDVEREKILHTQWKQRVEDWKRLHTDLAIQQFCEFMESDPIIHPPGARQVMDLWKTEQEIMNNKRLDLVNSLRDLKPPSSTKTAVYNWNQQITEISKQIDSLNQDYFTKLYGEYELVCQSCLEQVDIIKEDLVARGVCTPQKAQQVVTEQCLPLVGQTQGNFEKELEIMDKTLENHNGYLLGQLKSLFKFCQGAAHVWDVHELGLAKQERNLQEKLDDCRHKHDNQNQDKEANLDITMDRMRQDASEKSLADSLRKALDLLDKIKEGYFTFHQQQTDIVSKYPNMVTDELGRYDGSVLKFFGLSRPQSEESGEKEEKADPEAETPRPKSKSKKRSSSRASSTPPPQPAESPLPNAVSEILNTNKGSTFYVLTVAGEHGIPPEADDKDDEPAETSSTFLTESTVSKEQEKPEYIQCVDVSDDIILLVKKTIRLNFLNHLEEWSDQAVDRSNSVVGAKTEELNSELDLRLHLHEPRARRAELDVHNVRAAELVMHSERVSRHCKGINQALSDLKHRFNQMTQEHNKLADKFRRDIEALEVVFVNATKSSKLVSLSNQLQVEQDKYMEVIRASLRQFRKHLDDTLQMLRESNARFIKSFKLFSDGGNFCPEEIEEYRKRLEKMSNKIDSSEGFIMADLEGMESKRLEQASKISVEFEDRFKHHMIDLLFMEKIARWLTNTQVKIKAEVADSNTQAQKLAQYLKDLERRTDACERPNLDKEQVTPTQLNDGLRQIFEAFHSRSAYLNATKDPNPRPSSATMQGNPALGARVGFAPDTITTISKAGKQPTEDPSVGVIKNILKTQKARLQFGADAHMDGEGRPFNPGHGPHHGKGESPVIHHTTTFRKGSKIDKKYYVFGEVEEPGEDCHLLGRIKKVLREALDGLLSASEMYYRQKGNRAVTRPQALQETFEQCADAIVQKLQSYYSQSDEYHNQCLQELRRQLDTLEELVAHVPSCVIKELLARAVDEAKAERTQLDDEFANNLEGWDQTKSDNQTLLRPALGHPMHQAELTKLREKEEERKKEYLEGVENHAQGQQSCAGTHGQDFIDRLARCSEHLLLQFDSLLTIDDVERGRVPPKKHSTSELLRRKNAGQALEDDEDKEKLPRGKKTWQGLPKTEIATQNLDQDHEGRDSRSSKASSVKAKKKKESTLTASVTTAKTTLAHMAVVEARDKAYQDYKAHFLATLASIEEEKQKQTIAEQRWTESWQASVNKVQELYH